MVKEKAKEVIAVVVTYNRKELLKECINALKKQSYKNCKILVVDNGSTDNTYDYRVLRISHPQAKRILVLFQEC